MTNSTSITIKPGTLSLNHLFEIYRARPTLLLADDAYARMEQGGPLRGARSRRNPGTNREDGFDEVVQFDMAAHG